MSPPPKVAYPEHLARAATTHSALSVPILFHCPPEWALGKSRDLTPELAYVWLKKLLLNE